MKASPLPPDAAREPLSDAELAEAELVAKYGDHWDTGGRGDIERRNQLLVHRSIRWRTDANATTFEGRNARELTAREILLLKTRSALLNADEEYAIKVGGRTLLEMEKMNQRDELAYDPFKQPAPAGGSDSAGPAAVQVVIQIPDNGRGPVG